ncbi:MAG: InlB B-repeat-containing protein [Clostridia bacterium]|nr:InlB B-repeat-containing protein [Clostridia bacterium]
MLRKIYVLLLCVILIFSFSGCNSSNDTSSNLDSSIQNDISSTDVSSQDAVTLNEDLESGQSSSEESKPQSSSENSSKAEVNKPTEKVGEYTVTFNYGYDNKKITAKSQNYKVSKPEEPTRKGYKFLGWYADDETEQWSFSGHTVTTDMTLTAKWGKYSYHISYANVLDGVNTSILKQSDFNNITSRPDDTSTESKEPEKGKIVVFETYSVAVKDKTGFINGEINTSFSSVSSDEYEQYVFRVPNNFSVDTETFTIPELNVAGYTFLGWTYNGQTTPVKTVTISKGTAKDFNLIANWQS